MAKTLMMLGAICLLATVLMFDFVVVIPKFGSKYFGAPDDIKEMASKMTDQPAWVNSLGVLVLVAGFAGVAAVLVWAARDTLETKMSFWSPLTKDFYDSEGTPGFIAWHSSSCLPSFPGSTIDSKVDIPTLG